MSFDDSAASLCRDRAHPHARRRRSVSSPVRVDAAPGQPPSAFPRVMLVEAFAAFIVKLTACWIPSGVGWVGSLDPLPPPWPQGPCSSQPEAGIWPFFGLFFGAKCQNL